MTRLFIGSSVATVVLVAAGTTASRTIAAGPSVADPSGLSDDDPVVLSARLSSSEVVPQSSVLPSRASGRLTGRLTNATPSGVYFSAPSRDDAAQLHGPLWPTHLDRDSVRRARADWPRLVPLLRGACRSVPAEQHGVVLGQVGVYGGVATLARHPFYVEIATGRNPRGELSGQIFGVATSRPAPGRRPRDAPSSAGSPSCEAARRATR